MLIIKAASSNFQQLHVCTLDNSMFRLAGRLRLASVNRGAGLPPKRQFSVRAVYSSFPATLTYYRPKQLSSLFDHAENDSRPDDPYDEGVVIASDGLVYPGVNKTSVSNGAVMRPNTFTMQELVRRYYDEFLDRQEIAHDIEIPRIYTVPKADLILIHDFLSQFSLQPSRGMLLQDLNRSLDEFFDGFASKEDAESWLETHPFHLALSDDADSEWMTK